MYDIDGLRQYMGAPESETDEKLTPFLLAAVAEADVSGVPRFSNNALYDQFIYELATFHHDNRGLSTEFSGESWETKERMKASYVLQLVHAEEETAL